MTTTESKLTENSSVTGSSVTGSSVTEFRVTGMTCGHCERAIAQEVTAIAGVTGVEVSAATGRLLVTSATELDDELVLAAVDEAGYTAVRDRSQLPVRVAS